MPLDLANDLIDRILTVSLTLTPCVQPIEGSLAVGRIEAAVAHLDETIQIVRRAVFTQAQRDEASPRDASAKRHGDLDDIGAQLGTWARQIMNIAEATATKGIAADGTATMHLLDAAHSISRARMALTAALDRAF